MAVRFFTDSGADLPPHLAAACGIQIVPLTIHFGSRIYQDGVELTPTDFYRELRASADPPNTSQPSPGEFLSAYRQHSEPGDTLFSFHLSSKLSGTYQSAALAAKQLTDRTVHVIDTKSASLGIALPAIVAARAASQGVQPGEILAQAQAVINSTRIYFLVDTLEYLHRHGRIGKAQALMGGLLDIKPVLCVEDGLVCPADKVRGRVRALARVVELACKEIKPGHKYICAVPHADVPDVAAELVERLRQRLPDAEIIEAYLGPTIGTHAGPGALGIIISTLP